MSGALFEAAKAILESEISKFNTFLTENLADHEFAPADITQLREKIESVKSKLTQDIGKSFEEAVKTIVVPNWKVMFEADNYIDSGKTLDEQRTIISSILDSLNKTGFIDNTYLPDHIVEIMNRDFFNDNYKVRILIAELTAEYNLCNPDIHWIDANAERMRIMFYSGLFVGNLSKIEELMNVFMQNTAIDGVVADSNTVYELIEEHRNVNGSISAELLKKMTSEPPAEPVDVSVFASLCEDGIPGITNMLTKNDLKTLIQSSVEHGVIPSRKLSILDLAKAVILICIGVAPSDDWMDLKEDLENNKITGVTQAIAQGVNPLHILSTTIDYLNTTQSPLPTAHAWYVELMLLMYQDLDKCLEFCKSVSPYMFEVIFQRK